MQITIHRDGSNYGPYTVEHVNAMLASGQVAVDDLAWQEGSKDWVPLAQIPGVLRVPPPRSPRGGSRSLAARLPNESDRLILPAFLLAFFLGGFGIHRFYVGKTGSGIAMLLLMFPGCFLIVPAIVCGIWVVVDWVMIIVGSFTDAEGKYLKQWT